MPFLVLLSPDAVEHLRQLPARDRGIVCEAIRVHLEHDPLRESRNRKPMRPNALAPWELRVGAFRVYYDVEFEPERVVVVLAIGVKRRSRILIGGEEWRP